MGTVQIQRLGHFSITGGPTVDGPCLVFQAEQSRTGLTVRIRARRFPADAGPEAADEDAFNASARTAATLRHPSLAPPVGSGVERTPDGAWLYVVTLPFPGPTLADPQTAGTRFTPAQAVRAAVAMLDGLAVIHGAGLAHGDIGPGTVAIGADGRVMLDAMSLALVPRRTADRNADMTAVAALARRMLGGPGASRADIPSALAAVLDRAGTYPDTAALAAALTAALPPEPIPAATGSARRGPLLAAAAVAAILVAGGGWWYATQTPPTQTAPATAPAPRVTPAPVPVPVPTPPAAPAPPAPPPQPEPPQPVPQPPAPPLAEPPVVSPPIQAPPVPETPPATVAPEAPPPAEPAPVSRPESPPAPPPEPAEPPPATEPPVSAPPPSSPPTQPAPPQPDSALPVAPPAAEPAPTPAPTVEPPAAPVPEPEPPPAQTPPPVQEQPAPEPPAQPPPAVVAPEPAPTPEPPPPPPPPAPPPSPTEARERLAAALDADICGMVSASVSGDTLTVTGTVAGEDERARVTDLLDSLPPPLRGVADLTVTSAALCPPLQTIAPFRLAPTATTPALRSAVDAFVGGEDLVLTLTAPEVAAHIQVDYFTIDGSVVHMLPNPLEKTVKMAPGAERRLGERQENARYWEVAPPYGRELVVLFASPVPLFPIPRRAETEAADSYLTALREALAATPGTMAVPLFITTRAP